MKPRLLLAGNHLSARGGSRGPIEDLAEKLSARGYSCRCVSSLRNGVLRGADMLISALALRSSYDAAVVDLYSGRAFLWGEAISIVLKAMGRPFIMTLHGGGLPEFSASRKDRVIRCLSRAALVTAPSRYLLERMSSYRADIRLLPNPVNVAAYSFRERDGSSLRLIWVRAFHRIYNPEMAARVMTMLPGAQLTMVGGDRGDGTFVKTAAAARESGVIDRIQFAGSVKRDEVGSYLQQADIFINTTNYDNTPVSVIEAMACGLCVVSTDAGGIRYLIEDGVDGLLVPQNDAGAMAKAVLRIASSPELASRLSRNARAKAERFDWSRILPEWERLLASIAGVQPSGSTARQCATSGS